MNKQDNQLKIELNKIENEIKDKEDEFKFVSSKTKTVGAAAGFISGALSVLSFTPAGRALNAIRKIAPITGIKGAEMGYDIAEKGLQSLETDIALLKRDRDSILSRLKTAKEKLEN